MTSRLSGLLFLLASLVVSNSVFASTCGFGFYQGLKGPNCHSTIIECAIATDNDIVVANDLGLHIIEHVYSEGAISKELRNQLIEIHEKKMNRLDKIADDIFRFALESCLEPGPIPSG